MQHGVSIKLNRPYCLHPLPSLLAVRFLLNQKRDDRVPLDRKTHGLSHSVMRGVPLDPSRKPSPIPVTELCLADNAAKLLKTHRPSSESVPETEEAIIETLPRTATIR
jgi:hypothetical protein